MSGVGIVLSLGIGADGKARFGNVGMPYPWNRPEMDQRGAVYRANQRRPAKHPKSRRVGLGDTYIL